MGFYSPYAPGESPTAKLQSNYTQPTYSAGTSEGKAVGFADGRGFPEALQADQFLEDWGGVIGAVDVAARTPAYVYERPLAAVDTLLTRMLGGDRGTKVNKMQQEVNRTFLDDVTQTSDDNPFGVFGDIAGNLFHYSQGALNAGEAANIVDIWDKPDGEKVAFNETFLRDFGTSAIAGRTYGELKEEYRQEGWKDADVQALKNGEKGIFDFPDKRVVRGEGTFADIADFGAKILLDPTNVVFGVGLLTKTAKAADWTARLYKAATATNKGVIANGATKSSLLESMVGRAMIKGDNALRAYRNKVALPTAGVQLAGNVVGEAFPAVKEIPFFGDLVQLTEDIGNNKPLSQNDLFMVASMLNFPARHLMKEGYKHATKPLKRKLGQQLERAIVEELTPKFQGSSAKRLEAAMAVIGARTPQAWDDFLAHTMRTALNEKYQLLSMNPLRASFYGENIADLGFHMAQMQKRMSNLIAREFEAGKLSPQDVKFALHRMVEGRGGAVQRQQSKVPGMGIEAQRFTPEKLGQTWRAWEPIARELSEQFGGRGSPIVPAIADNYITVEGIQWMQYMLRDLRSQYGGMVPADLVEAILMDQPVIFKYARNAEVSRVLAKSTKEVDIDKVINALGDAKKHGYTMREWTAPVTEWEGSALRASERTAGANRMLDENLTLRDSITPEYGDAEVVVYDGHWDGPRKGAPGHVDQLRALRTDPDIAMVESVAPLAIRESGLSVDSAVQVASIDGKVSSTAVSLRMPGGIDAGEIETVAVLMQEATGAKKILTIRRGKNEMLRHGETPNAVEVTFDPKRRLNVDELNELAEITRARFGDDVIINDTTGVIRVFVRDGMDGAQVDRGLALLQKKMGVEPKQQQVALSYLKKKVGKKDASTTSFADATKRAKTDQRYWVGRSGIERRIGPDDVSGFDDLASGPRSGGPDGQPPGRGGSGAYRTGEDVPLTRWESQRGNAPAGGVSQYAVQPERLAEFRGRAAEALGHRANVPPGSRLFQLGDGSAGAWVSPGGTLRVWRKSRPGRNLDAELNELIADASEHAVSTRVVHKRTRVGGRNSTGSTVDIYGAHGWRVVGYSNGPHGDIVHLIRDVAGDSGFPEIPPRSNGYGGYQLLREQGKVKRYRSAQQATAMVHGNANALYPDGVVLRMPKIEEEAQSLLTKHSLSQLEEMAVQDPTNLAVLRARDIGRLKAGGTSGGGALWEEGTARTQGGAASDESLAEIGMKRDADGSIVPIDDEPVLKLSTKDATFGESGAAERAAVDWDASSASLPPKGTPGNITRSSLPTEADGWWKFRVVHYDDAGVPDGVLTYKVGRQDFIDGQSAPPLPPGVATKDTIFATELVVRPDARGKGIGKMLYDEVEGQGYDVLSAPRNFTPDGQLFWDSYTGQGPWYYHGTERAFADSIESVGMRSGNPNGNWTQDYKQAQRFAGTDKIVAGQVTEYAPIYRTRKPGGKAVNDQVVAGGHVQPADMMVSHDGGLTWEHVSVRNARKAAKQAEAQRVADMQDDISEHLGRSWLDEPGKEGYAAHPENPQLDYDDWFQSAVVNENEWLADINEALTWHVDGNGYVHAMTTDQHFLPSRSLKSGDPKVWDDLVGAEDLEMRTINGEPVVWNTKVNKPQFVADANGNWAIPSPARATLVFFKKDGSIAGYAKIELDGGGAFGSMDGGSIRGYHDSTFDGLTTHWNEGPMPPEAFGDVVQYVRNNISEANGDRLAASNMRLDSRKYKEWLGTQPTDNPRTFRRALTAEETYYVEGYEAAASERMNQPLRRGQSIEEVELGHPENQVGEIATLQRGLMKGTAPRGPNANMHDPSLNWDNGEYVTFRGETASRYGAETREYARQLEELQVGDEIVDPAFVSTSEDPTVAYGWFGDGDDNIHWVMYSRPGSPMGHFGGREAEVLLPMRSRFRIRAIEKVWKAGQPPTTSMSLEIHDTTRKALIKQLQLSKQRRVSVLGYADPEFEGMVDRLIDQLNALETGRRVPAGGSTNPAITQRLAWELREGGGSMQTDIQHLMTEVDDLLGVYRNQKDDFLERAARDADDELFSNADLRDELEKLNDELNTGFVRNQGSTLNIEAEYIGVDWLDPDLVDNAVDLTQSQGGGTFTIDGLESYDAAQGGYAVGQYRNPKTGSGTYARRDIDDADGIEQAILDVKEQFPDAEYIGTWHDMLGDGQFHISPTRVLKNVDDAFELARHNNQKAIYDFSTGKDIPVPNAYNMNKADRWTRKNGTPRTQKQNARDYARAVTRSEKASGRKFPVDKEILEAEGTTIYLDPNGQTGAVVSPEGELVHYFSVDDARTKKVTPGDPGAEIIPEGRTPIDIVLREVHGGERGVSRAKIARSTTPEQAAVLERNGYVHAATADGNAFWVRAELVGKDVDLMALINDPAPNLISMEEGYRRLYDIMGTEPPSGWWGERIAREAEQWEGGLVKYLYDEADEVSNFVPHIDPSLQGKIEMLSPEQAQKIYALEADLRRYKTGYTLKLAPEDAVPFYTEAGSEVRKLFGHARTLEKTWYEKAVGPAAQVWDKIASPVYSRNLARMQQQHMYDEFAQHGFSIPEVNAFIHEVKQTWEKMPTGPGGTRVFRRPDSLAPNTLARIAHETLPADKVSAMMKKGDSITDLVQRSGSRTYRHLSEKFPATGGGGKGHIGGIMDTLYGKTDSSVWGVTTGAKVGRRGLYGVKTAYHVFRFLADPRWIAMNWFEGDWLALGRAGMRGGKIARGAKLKGGARAHARMSKNMEMGQSVDDILAWDQNASGWLDPRNLNAKVNKVFDHEARESTQKAIIAKIKDGDPVIDDLKAMFGDMEASQWADELNDILYKLDTKGARNMVLDEAAEQGMKFGQNAMFDEFLENLWKQHEDIYRDIMHIFHGNVNRTNLERFLNSPLLWWPLSYQLKAGKWVFDMLTDRFAGVQSDLLGAGYLSYAVQRHNQLMESNDTYQGIWMDHPALWRAMSMAVPMTPFDMGVYMARWTRYGSSWAGAQLGLWEADTAYPQTLPEFIVRSTKLGPLFSVDMWESIADELNYRY